MTRLTRVTKRAMAALVILFLLASVTGTLILRSGWFRERIRERIVAELERSTGGRAELGTFDFEWTRLVATVSPLVLHGRESAGEEPFLRIPSVRVGLRLISMFERKVDLASLWVDQPAIRIVLYPDGSTNLPVPPARTGTTTWAANLLDIGVRHYEISRGIVEYDHRRIPLDLRGEDLRLQMNYRSVGPVYIGEFSSKRLRVAARGSLPAELDVAASFTLAREQIEFSRIDIATGASRANLNGTLSNLSSPRGKFTVKSTVALSDAVSLTGLPLAAAGTSNFEGDLDVSFLPRFDFTLNGRLNSRGLGYSYARLKLQDVDVRADLRATPEGVWFRSLEATALRAKVSGQGELSTRGRLRFEGKFEDLDFGDAVAVLADRPVPWSGTINGDASVEAVLGQPKTKVVVNATIVSSGQGAPIEGQIEVGYDQSAGTVRLGSSHVSTPSTRLELSGTLGETLQVRANSTNLDDIVPVLRILDPEARTTLPVKLDRGSATASGTVSGALDRPRFRGHVDVDGINWEGRLFSRLKSEVDASRESISLRRVSATYGATVITGDANIAQDKGSFEDGAIAAQLSVRNASLADAVKELSLDTPLGGTAAAVIRAMGTLQNPAADVSLDISESTAYGEQFGHVRATIHYENTVLRVSEGESSIGGGKLAFSGVFSHPPGDWRNGSLEAQFSTQGVMLSRVNALRERAPNINARIDAVPNVRARLVAGQMHMDSVRGTLDVRNLILHGELLGELSVQAQTRGSQLELRASGRLRDTAIQGQGTWRLDSNEPGSGSMRFSKMTVATLYDLVMAGVERPQRPPPPAFEGYLQGGATFSFPLRVPSAFQAEARIDALQITPRSTQALRLGAQLQDVAIRNTQPIVIGLTRDEARIRSGHFTARDTNLEATGILPFRSGAGADLTVKGSVNLAVLQLLNPDMLAKGTATVTASIRGSLRNPQLNGRMEMKEASLYLADVPNGIDNATGVILFDRNRATVERLTAETGGGTVSLGGFLEFGEPLVYRLRADVRQVRLRYPEDVSTTAGAQFALNGTSDSSTLSGTLTLNRASINSGADLGRLLASSSRPAVSPDSGNAYLRGLRFDIHVESAPTFEMETSLTRNVQANVDLRLRGTPVRPVLNGDISVNSGEVELFGTRYAVNRGDIRFLNPLRIEPTLDVNLETKARGITVTVSLSGTPQRLNVNYSSDPPLQSREIIALLAVGRDPNSGSSAAAGQLGSSTANFGDAGGLLGQAVSQQLSNRLQRFFGASRVKIDPTLTGVVNLPEARLTIEQQVSRDITLTYITNLNRTQEQIVRMQWDLSPQWSAIAIRKANGLFGVDFQFRKRFK